MICNDCGHPMRHHTIKTLADKWARCGGTTKGKKCRCVKKIDP